MDNQKFYSMTIEQRANWYNKKVKSIHIWFLTIQGIFFAIFFFALFAFQPSSEKTHTTRFIIFVVSWCAIICDIMIYFLVYHDFTDKYFLFRRDGDLQLILVPWQSSKDFVDFVSRYRNDEKLIFTFLEFYFIRYSGKFWGSYTAELIMKDIPEFKNDFRIMQYTSDEYILHRFKIDGFKKSFVKSIIDTYWESREDESHSYNWEVDFLNKSGLLLKIVDSYYSNPYVDDKRVDILDMVLDEYPFLIDRVLKIDSVICNQYFRIHLQERYPGKF
jgi:hypothetical protein